MSVNGLSTISTGFILSIFKIIVFMADCMDKSSGSLGKTTLRLVLASRPWRVSVDPLDIFDKFDGADKSAEADDEELSSDIPQMPMCCNNRAGLPR